MTNTIKKINSVKKNYPSNFSADNDKKKKKKRSLSKKYLQFFSKEFLVTLPIYNLKTSKDLENFQYLEKIDHEKLTSKSVSFWKKNKLENSFPVTFSPLSPYRYISNRKYWLKLKEKEALNFLEINDKDDTNKDSIFFHRKYINYNTNKLERLESELTIPEKIKLETRKKYQAYMALDYYLSSYSYFDYFSRTALRRILFAKKFGQAYFRDDLTHELLCVSFFPEYYPTMRLIKTGKIITPYMLSRRVRRRLVKNLRFFNAMLRKHDLNNKLIRRTIAFFQDFQNHRKEWQYNQIGKYFVPIIEIFDLLLVSSLLMLNKVPTKNKLFKQIENIGFTSEKILDTFIQKNEKARNEKIRLSTDVNFICKKAIENARLRFKTPIVNSPILFLTLMELEKSKVSSGLKQIMVDNIEWELLRYRLIRELHNEEVAIRLNIVGKNQRFFSYLLKSQIEDQSFLRLVEENTIGKATLYFRNKLIRATVKMDLGTNMKLEIFHSLKLKGFQRKRKNKKKIQN